MNELINSQRIQKRHGAVRPPSRLKIRPETRHYWPGSLSVAARLKAIIRSAAFRRGLAIAALGAAAAAVFTAAAVSYKTQSRVQSLLSAPDGMLENEMRTFVGLKQLEGAARGNDDLASLDLVETFRFDSYTVRRGDSLSSIAQERSLDIGSLIASNGITNAKGLQAGTVLKIPNMDGVMHTVRKGDSLSRIASLNGIPMEAILDANELESETIHPGMKLFLPGARMNSMDLRRALGDLFIYPLRGRLTSPFGWRSDPFTGVRRFHAAIDLAAPLGTPVRAAMEGRVSAIGYNNVYGKYVILTHPGGYQSWYAHLSEYRTEKGAAIKQGQVVGEVGSTGYSTGNHVHFAVFKNGRALNPLPLLSKR